ncbi:MAG TPA: amidohydrolase family protein [Terriglobales bacterium]|nr:amidohydrolase family protein [Terriglobales bacterium]
MASTSPPLAAPRRAFFPLLLALVALTGPALAADRYDVIIRNGRVIDGAGNPWFHADVGVRVGKIAAIGDLHAASATKEIDASGLYVAPGFIDMHNHSDRGLRDPNLRPAEFWLIQGITTVVLGIDGLGTVEMMDDARQWQRAGMGVNTAFYIGQNPIRTKVIGIVDRAATPAEREQMKQMVRQGMEAGAFGLSTGLVYIPSVYSSTDEVVELAKVAAEYGGIYDTHHRDEMTSFMPSLRETLAITERAHIPLMISHIKVMGQDNWGQMAEAVALINAARARGQEITANQYPFPNGAVRTSVASVLQIPPGMGHLEQVYNALHGNPPDFANDAEQKQYVAELVKALDDPARREQIRKANDEGINNPSSRNWIRKWGYGWLRVEVSTKNPQYVGKTIPQIAALEHTDGFSIAEKLLRTEDEHFVISIGPCDERDVVAVLKQPWLSFSSDGELTPLGPRWINPRSLGSFARVYRKYVREEGVLSLEEAVRKMTGLAAQSLRLRDRGLLREGLAADIVVFDAEHMADRSSYADSLHYPDGVLHVLVNGSVALENRRLTGHPAGRVLYRNGTPNTALAHAQATNSIAAGSH